MVCPDCGAERKRLQKHHILPRSLGGSDDPSNLIYICANCHEDRHGTEEGRLPWIQGSVKGKDKKSEAMKQLWKDPDYVSKMESRIHWSRNPEAAALVSSKLKEWWEDSANRDKILNRNQKISEARQKIGNKKLHEIAKEKFKERDTQILALKSQGKNSPEIARIVGCSKVTVCRVLKENGISGRTHCKRGHSLEEHGRLRKDGRGRTCKICELERKR